MSLTQEIKNLAMVDIFAEAKKADLFIGRPYYLDFDKAYLLITDAWKEKVGGIPQGTFLLAFYENENDDVDECLLLRALRPAKLPTDNDVIASMVEYYKDNLKTSGKKISLMTSQNIRLAFQAWNVESLARFTAMKVGKFSLAPMWKIIIVRIIMLHISLLVRFLNKSLILETETLLLAAIQITESEKFDIVPAGAFKISIQTFPYMSVQVIF